MRCDECGSNENEYCERMGEKVCKGCGLVLVSEMFEETTHSLDRAGTDIHSAERGELGSIIRGKGSWKYNKHGMSNVTSNHIQKGLNHCNMVLSSVGVNSPQLKSRVHKLYTSLATKGVFGRSPYEARATALVYYTLKENGTPHPFNDVCSEFNPPIKVVKRLVRKINQIHRNSINYHPVNPQYLLTQLLSKLHLDMEFERQCIKVLEHFEVTVSELNFNKGRSYYASIIWISANIFLRKNITKESICEASGFSRWIVWRQTKAILTLVGLESVKSTQGKSLNEIGN